MKILSDPNSASTHLTSIGGTYRWMAPELLDPEAYGKRERDPFSKETDIYALGMVILEVRLPLVLRYWSDGVIYTTRSLLVALHSPDAEI